MKKLVILFASLFVLVIAAENVNAQTSASESVTASATIIQPITLTKSLDLNFGTLVPSGTNGSVTIPATGARTSIDVGFIDQEADYNAASFLVNGQKDYTFSLSLPASIDLSNGTETMKVSAFTSSLSAATGIAIANGGTPFTVGATIDVKSNQAAGEYNGTFDVTVAYE